MFHMRFEDINECRSFCRNELSATVDGDGGVVTLDWIDCYYHHDGTVFPDEIKLPVFSRDHASKEKYPAYGAAVQLYTRETCVGCCSTARVIRRLRFRASWVATANKPMKC